MVFNLLSNRMDSFSPKDNVPASQKYQCSSCGHVQVFMKKEQFPFCEYCNVEHQWIPTGTILSFVTKNLNREFERISNLHLKFADFVTEWVGHVGFLYIQICWFTFWILINTEMVYPGHVFDPYPFSLLTMTVSLEAIILTTLVMVSQNVQSKRAELRAELDYQVNLKAEKEIVVIHEELKRNNEMTQRLLECVEAKRKRKID